MGYPLRREKWQIIIGKNRLDIGCFKWPNTAIAILCASKRCKYLEIHTSRYYFCITTKIQRGTTKFFQYQTASFLMLDAEPCHTGNFILRLFFSMEKKLKLAVKTAETSTRMSKSSQPSTISPITMVMIPQEEWQSLNDKLDRLAEMIENRNASDRDAEWLESEAARKQLGVSPKTWQNYRDQRVIPFSQIGRKIYVNRADLNAFLRSHRIGEVK